MQPNNNPYNHILTALQTSISNYLSKGAGVGTPQGMADQPGAQDTTLQPQPTKGDNAFGSMNTQPMVRAMTPSQGLSPQQGKQMSNFLLPTVNSPFGRNSQQQFPGLNPTPEGTSGGNNLRTSLSDTMAQNPYMNFLQKLGVGTLRPRAGSPQQSFFSQQGQKPGMQPNVMAASWNVQNNVIPNRNNIGADLVMAPVQQQQNDLI